MSIWKVKKGNTSVRNIPIYKKDGVTLVDNLASVLTAKFVVRDKATKVVKIERTKGSGIEMNTPILGWVRITLVPTNTNIAVEKYDMGLEFSWDADTCYEVKMYVAGKVSKEFEIEEGVV